MQLDIAPTLDQQSLDRLVGDFKKEIAHVGGVKQYMNAMLDDHAFPGRLAAFDKDLTGKLLVKPSNTTYQTSRPIPAWHETEPTNNIVVLHLIDFGFGADASLNLPVEMAKSNDLLDRMVTEGFLTVTEPIVVSERNHVLDVSSRGGVPILPHTMCFVKGQGRTLTVTGFVLYCWIHDTPLPDIIAKTAATIYAKREDLGGDQQEIFHAMHIGYRSAVRRAPSLVQWIWSLIQLQKKSGTSPVNVLADWNKVAPRSDQIVGGKATSVKNVICMPTSCTDLIISNVSSTGWEKSPYTDDNLGSKKLKVGANLKNHHIGSGSKWYTRLLVTEDGLKLCLRSLGLKAGGAKMTKADVEYRLECCTLAIHLYNEVVQSTPNLIPGLTTGFLDRIAVNDALVLAQLETALASKEEGLLPRDLPVISHIVNEYAVAGGTSDTLSAMEAQLRCAQEGIDLDQWTLFKKEVVEFDGRAIRIYYGNSLQFQESLDGQRDYWKTKVRDDNKSNCLQFLHRVVTHAVLKSDEQSRVSDLQAHLKAANVSLAQRLQLDYSQIVTLPFLNFSAPSLISTSNQVVLMQVLQFTLNENADNMGMMLSPIHAYKKGAVWVQDQAIIKTLATVANCNVDRSFTLLFKDKKDSRDNRPLTYPGTLYEFDPWCTYSQ